MITPAQRVGYFRLPFILLAISAMIGGIATIAFPMSGIPVLIALAFVLFWAVRTAWFSRSHLFCLGGYLLILIVDVISMFSLIAAGLGRRLATPGSDVLWLAVYVLYAVAVLAITFHLERRIAWKEFQTTKSSLRVTVANNEVHWTIKSKTPMRAGMAALAIGGGALLVTLANAYFGKMNAQLAIGLACALIAPPFIFGFAARGFVGWYELLRLERASGRRFAIPDADAIQRARAASWFGRLINPEVRKVI
ncbi:hypothetical protein GCM10027093_04880 [Paraburkholderia jirisanensis]